MPGDRTIFHVVRDGQAWELRLAEQDVVGTYATKGEAVVAGRERARAQQPAQLVIHSADGRIEDEATYAADPFLPPG